jgi:hypothetical protein
MTLHDARLFGSGASYFYSSVISMVPYGNNVSQVETTFFNDVVQFTMNYGPTDDIISPRIHKK